MAIPSWPPTLPQKPLKEGYSQTYPNNLLKSSVDSGVSKVRRKGGKVPSQVTMRMLMTKAQLATLTDFVEDTIEDGALIFNFTHPITDASVIVRFKSEEQDLFTLTSIGDLFTVAFKLEVMP